MDEPVRHLTEEEAKSYFASMEVQTDGDWKTTRVWLTSPDGDRVEVTNFCKAVRKDPRSPLATVTLLCLDYEHIEDGYDVSVP